VERKQVLAFRLGSQHLEQRLPAGSLLEAAAACGVQNTPPGSATLALHARVERLNLADVERALARDRHLLLVWSVRGAPYLVPTRDAGVFTRGALPGDEASFRVLLQGSAKALLASGLAAADMLRLTAGAMREALDGRVLSKGALSTEVTRRVPKAIALWCPGCQAQHVPETLFRAVGLLGEVCFAGSLGEGAGLARTDQWLDGPLPALDAHAARAELVRRYLRCYGPSTPAQFAEWSLLGLEEARGAFGLLESELAQVDADGTTAWLLASDVPALEAPPPAIGARLLPPHDPYLQMRDRATLVPDRALQRRVWQPLGSPGVVLVEGQLVGVWRPQKRGRRLRVNVELFGPLSREARGMIEREAKGLAPYRGCEAAEVVFGENAGGG
jgi:hypothetical protein